MLSRISNLGFGKFGVENAISKLQFGGVENLGGKCYLEISNLGGGWNIWGGKCYLESPIWVGGKFGVENAVSNLEFGGWKIWGGKCYLESPIWVGGKFGVENAISNVKNLGWKMLSRISNLGGGKFGV